MNHNLSPKPVPAIAVLRWARQAGDLIRRGFIAWVALMAVFCIAASLVRTSVVLATMLSSMAFLFGIRVAALVDDTSERTIGEMVGVVMGGFGVTLRYAGVVVLTVAVLNALPALLLGNITAALRPFHNPGLQSIWSATDTFTAINEMFVLPIAGMLMFLCCFIMPLVASTFQYHLISFFGVNWRQAYRTGRAGLPRMNIGAIFGFYLVAFGLLALTVAFAPIAAPVVFAFLSAFSYVAFREIYLGIGTNRKVALAELRAVASFT